MNDWSPTPLEIALIRIRIAERTPKKINVYEHDFKEKQTTQRLRRG